MPRGFGRRGRGRKGFVHGDFLSAALLLLIKKKPSHGYELVQRLLETNFYDFEHDPAVVYNLLRKMEISGLIMYELEAGGGPFRKVYKITPEGERYLEIISKEIEALYKQLKAFLVEYKNSNK
ncbi:PadR family transcriptional regulator [Thermosipho atlanticus]|uniref:Transcriptional regulator, PadR family n=1 Tax=Thermosipho atlanticus DSM 15807 TaxID=1123380 RepID=A0A1M5QVQ0_9BACT|nr:PadR family transcriptional regulator [Thermosipho atlanticus]SHH17946.1 transcriptional regulator, PadR family [Thermosipho atlanticus DSM 15807]